MRETNRIIKLQNEHKRGKSLDVYYYQMQDAVIKNNPPVNICIPCIPAFITSIVDHKVTYYKMFAR